MVPIRESRPNLTQPRNNCLAELPRFGATNALLAMRDGVVTFVRATSVDRIFLRRPCLGKWPSSHKIRTRRVHREILAAKGRHTGSKAPVDRGPWRPSA